MLAPTPGLVQTGCRYSHAFARACADLPLLYGFRYRAMSSAHFVSGCHKVRIFVGCAGRAWLPIAVNLAVAWSGAFSSRHGSQSMLKNHPDVADVWSMMVAKLRSEKPDSYKSACECALLRARRYNAPTCCTRPRNTVMLPLFHMVCVDQTTMRRPCHSSSAIPAKTPIGCADCLDCIVFNCATQQPRE